MTVSTDAPANPDGGGESGRVSADAFARLGALHQVTLEAFLSGTRQELIFRLLNRTLAVLPYNRAALWRFASQRPTLLGVSGQAGPKADAPLATRWAECVRHLREPQTPRILAAADMPEREREWEELNERIPNLSVLWLPLNVEGELAAGLWLERWTVSAWEEKDLKLAASLAVGYGAAWQKTAPAFSPLTVARTLLKRTHLILLLIALALALIFVNLHLRVVAPCEVVAYEPRVIAAPLDGVVEAILIKPGERVEPGAPLFAYDRRGPEDDLAVAREQVRVKQAELRTSWHRALEEDAVRERIPGLEFELAMEKVRLRLAEATAAELEVRAPIAGTVMIDKPHEWRGRPVQIGQKVMTLVHPGRSKVRLWIPEGDNVAFDRTQPITVVLDAVPGARKARLNFVAIHSSVSPRGVPGFFAEAEWLQPQPGLKLGLRGTAIAYGEKVSLGYWLLRKPLTTLRRWLGI